MAIHLYIVYGSLMLQQRPEGPQILKYLSAILQTDR